VHPVSHHLSTLGSRFRALREARQLTQADLADSIGISQRHVSAIELGHAMPSIAVADTAAEVFGVTLDELVRGAGEDTPEPGDA
jgi:transcriptional regulator with XRE-family HTH domain